MGGRLAQRPPRQQAPRAERLLAVHEDDIQPPPAELPVLKTVIEEQRVAAELLDRVTTALHTVLVHEHDDVLEVGREHIGFVAGHFGVEQERFTIGNDAGRRSTSPREWAEILRIRARPPR